MEHIPLFTAICYVTFSLSTLSAIILYLLLQRKQSNYSKLMMYLCLSEALFIFAEFMVVIRLEGLNDFFARELNLLFFDLFDKSELRAINLGFYFSNQTFSLLINNFVCLETILTLRNPISAVRKRLKTYFLLTFLSSLVVFFIAVYTNKPPENTNILQDLLFYPTIVVYFNLVVFIFFLIIILISFLYLINRFCMRKNMASNLRNKFVMRHICYYLMYLVTLTPYYVFSLMYLIDTSYLVNNPLFDISIILHLSLGFIMFIIRASETCFYKVVFCQKSNKNQNNYISNNSLDGGENEKKKIQGEITEGFLDPDQPLTVMINKTLNLEFMCCVLFGLSEIFTRSEKKKKAHNGDASSINFINSTLVKTLGSNVKKEITKKDFQYIKSHLIYYSKIYENFDLNDITMKVKKKKGSYQNMTFDDNTSQYTEFQKGDDEMKQDALMIEYCPKIFKELRILDDISNKELENSFDPKLNRTNMERIKESEGKSGSFFFFSHDQKFLIKTLTSSELNTFLGEFVVNYYEHLINCPETLLAKIYGVYTVVINNVSKIHVILMQNLLIFPTSHIKRIFDLKGSKVDRFTKNIEKVDKFKTLKDLDYLWMTKIETDLVDFTKHACLELDSVLQSDLGMLRDVNIMDYSLMLIVIHFPNPEESE